MKKGKLVIFSDGGSRGNPGEAGAGAVVYDALGNVLKRSSKYLGVMTNNEAEYEAVLLGLSEVKKMFGKEKLLNFEIEVRMDSELVSRQLSAKYQIKEEKLVPYFIKIWNMKITHFPNITFIHIPRAMNKEADRLANEAMDLRTHTLL